MPAQSSTLQHHPRPSTLALFAACLLIGFAMFPGPILAAEVLPVGPPLAPALPPVARPLVRFDWQGELRMRGEAIHGMRLSTDPEQPAHLVLRHGSIDPPDVPQLPAGQGVSYFSLDTADLRLRLQPVMHVGEWTDVHGQIDLGRGVVLGSDPRTADVIQQVTTIPGQGPLRDGVSVRRLWLTGRLFGFAEVDIGRMGDHFGMGMYRNGGSDLLSDFQDDVDRVAVRADLFGLRLMVARDSLSSSPNPSWGSRANEVTGKDATTGKDVTGTWTSNTAVQQTLQDSNDLSRWVLEVHGGKRKADLGLQWAFALLYATQETALLAEHQTDVSFQGNCATTDCFLLISRKARFLDPEVALDWRGKLGNRSLRWEAEGVLHYGTFDNIGARTTTGTETSTRTSIDSPLTLVAGGIATRATLRGDHDEWKLDAGYASGSSDGGFGVNDTDNLRWNGSSRPDAPFRTFLSGFHFHRNYRIDGLLFRDVIGAVANTVFIKPAWRFLLADGSHTLGLEGSVLAAVAASSAATPGKGSLLGIEPEVTLDYRGGSGMTGLLRGSLLVPGSAFSAEGQSASLATRIEAIWRLSF